MAPALILQATSHTIRTAKRRTRSGTRVSLFGRAISAGMPKDPYFAPKLSPLRCPGRAHGLFHPSFELKFTDLLLNTPTMNQDTSDSPSPSNSDRQSTAKSISASLLKAHSTTTTIR